MATTGIVIEAIAGVRSFRNAAILHMAVDMPVNAARIRRMGMTIYMSLIIQVGMYVFARGLSEKDDQILAAVMGTLVNSESHGGDQIQQRHRYRQKICSELFHPVQK